MSRQRLMVWIVVALVAAAIIAPVELVAEHHHAQRPPLTCTATHVTGGNHFRWSVWTLNCTEAGA